ncbi:phosphatidate cytidylyltransferase [Lignipirellula cremea]|uniref:Phosphatidate cytidylyltransferase n=1 Tax=Lignipirellula cremea TaxID=2528010 RepID=A0A518DP25_9BACT|nr:phosphatidate cytidylyltransferase [Lignipirellula cremea]QDU93585.1 Phosphatidate cytidylyltransferase [Lignipirellula cremea]
MMESSLLLSQISAWQSSASLVLLAGVMTTLLLAALAGWFLQRQPETIVNPLVVRTFRERINAWWVMWAVLGAASVLGYFEVRAGYIATVTLFGMISFWSLREYITMTPTRRGDHRTLFWTFFLLTPTQYILVGLGRDYYEAYSIAIPVYASLFIPARIALSGDPKRFLERSAKIQLGLLICVYSLSYAPALLDLQLRTRVGAPPNADLAECPLWDGSPTGLLFFFILVVQLGDVFQYAWGQLLGKRVIAPEINASRTWEGLFGGAASTALAGALLWWVTPFTFWGAACMSLIVAILGFAGGMVMSAIKRDRGVRDYGTLVQGHAGLLDRIDSVCFAAPVFFHLTKYFLEVN